MSLNVNVLDKGKNHIKLLFEGVSLPLLNAVRRVALAEVPTMAVDEVIFVDNTSALYDEIIAHRLGMIPLTSDDALEKYKMPEDCAESTEVEGCYTILTLDVSAKDEVLTVYSRDLISQDPDVRPVSPDIPIAVLAPGQRLAFEARARLGRGKEHIKWSPSTVATVTYLAKVSLNSSRCNLCGKCIEVCPRGVLKLVRDGIEVDEGKCILCRQCVKVCDRDAIDLSWYEDKYVLYIESSGALKPERILSEALKVIINKLQIIYNELNKLGSVGGVKMRRTGPTNINLRLLIKELNKYAKDYNAPIWSYVAELLSRPARKRVVVNLSKLNRYANDGDVVVVPGKVLGGGSLTKKITLATVSISLPALEKVRGSGSRVIHIKDLIREFPKGSGVKVVI